MPDVKQFVVVVIVGLEHNKLRQRQNCQPAAVEPPLFGLGVDKRRNQQQIHKPDIFDVKPEIIVLQCAVVLAVDPVEVQPQHVLAVQALGQHGGQHLRQPRRAAHCRQPQPGQKRLPPCTLRQSVYAAHKAQKHQRQRTVGMQKRQRQRQQGQPWPKAALALIAELPQQVHGGKEHAPAKQRCPLGDEQIDDGVDPLDVLLHKIRRCGVEPGEDARKLFSTAEKIHKAEPAAHKEQVKRKARLGGAVRHPAGQLPEHTVHRQKCGQHRQKIRRAQVRPQHQKHAGDSFAQEWIPETVLAAQ